jgi:hypothetical protein
MHLFTDSKAALKEAVTRPSERLSPYEVISRNNNGPGWRDVVAAIHRAPLLCKNPALRLQTEESPSRKEEERYRDERE